jgi:hypothetical protein
LPPDDQDQHEADQQEKQAGEAVQKTDDFVVGRVEQAKQRTDRTEAVLRGATTEDTETTEFCLPRWLL